MSEMNGKNGKNAMVAENTSTQRRRERGGTRRNTQTGERAEEDSRSKFSATLRVSALSLRLGLVLALAVGLAGCVSLTKPFPVKRFYVIEAAPPAAESPRVEGTALLIRKFRVSPSFAANGFVYRVGEHEFETDYYNEFFVGPEEMIGEQAARYLAASGPFERVAQAGSAAPTHMLEGSVAALYGDYRAPASPKAALEMQFVLLADADGEARIIFQKNYAREIALPADSPAALAAAWSEALAGILAELAEDCAKADPKPAPADAGPAPPPGE